MEGMAEEIDSLSKEPGLTQFSSGLDYDDKHIAERSALIEKAKKGCKDSKYRLMNHPYYIKALVLDRQIII
jgi:hypothetical protein